MLEKAVLATLGALTLTKEKSKEWVDHLVKKGEIAKEEAPDFLKQLVKKGDEARTEIDRRITVAIEKFSTNMNFATKSDVEELRTEIRKLSKKLEKKASPKKRGQKK